MFKYIARYYDSTNRLLSLGLDRYWRTRAVAALAPKRGMSILDVGCGTGDISIEIIRTCPECRVVGIDPSFHMLKVGQEKIRTGRLSNIELGAGSVLDLSYMTRSFDAAITSFCIRNVTDRRRGLLEMRRVLKPGGSIVILELTEPLGGLMKPLFRLYSRVMMPALTSVMSSVSAYRYLAESMADFPPPPVFTRILEDCGYKSVTHEFLTGGIVTLYTARVG